MSPTSHPPRRLSHGDLLRLKRWNTPSIYNGWEQITRHDAAQAGFNREATRDFMPELGSMIGYAVTLTIEPTNPAHAAAGREAWRDYRAYVAGVPGPKIVVVQDLDQPAGAGSFWGEVNANIHRALGCVGTITDGAIRDLDEMRNAGFKALARHLCVGHAHVCPVRWDQPVEVFGRRVCPGALIHADQHGFLVIPDEDQERLLEAVEFMDANECRTLIAAARGSAGRDRATVLRELEAAQTAFARAVEERFGQGGEW